ncbi:Clp protease N-terminal domain-containing protein [Micromonospora sp. NPDC050417]|uniref:Clp protease N-terminal domain-containing protein n=1 Tax=Micromonospora sp. NPDC050417 TaxID=3364280 RepID=UPI003789F740
MAGPPARLDELITYVVGREPDGPALERLSDANLVAEYLGDVADHLVGHFVELARQDGASWAEIGRRLGVSKQAAQKRFVAKRAEAADLLPPGVLARFTDRARNVMERAEEEARQAGHDEVNGGHLLLGLMHEPDGLAVRALLGLGAPTETVRAATRATLDPPGAPRPGPLTLSPGAQRVRDLTFQEALRLGHNYVGTEHLLLGLLRRPTEPGARVLVALGVTREAVEAWVVEAYARAGSAG